MKIFVLTLVAAIVLRVFLDLSSLGRSSYLFNVLYVILFTAMGAVMFFQDSTDIFAYLSIVVAVIWGWFGYYKYKGVRRTP